MWIAASKILIEISNSLIDFFDGEHRIEQFYSCIFYKHPGWLCSCCLQAPTPFLSSDDDEEEISYSSKGAD